MEGHSIGERSADREVVRAGASLDAKDVSLLRRLSIAIVMAFLFIGAFHRLDLLYSHKFFDVTGRADWIWAPAGVTAKAPHAPKARPESGIARKMSGARDDLRQIAALSPFRNGHFDRAYFRQTVRDLFTRDDRPMIRRDNPLAFFATRDFDLPPNRYYTHIKIAADPEYTLYFNGREIGGRRFGDDSKLDVYDVSGFSKNGRNRIVVAVRSTTGFGGLIVSVDIAPEAANFVISDGSWTISRQWTPDLLVRDPQLRERPIVIGEPPVGRWNYLEPETRPVEAPTTHVLAPRSSTWFRTALPEVRDTSGTAIVSKRPERATAYDFGGFVDGRLRVTRLYEANVPEVVNVRFANAPDELRFIEAPVRPFVFAPGETSIVDTEVRHFRYASVYGRPAKADALQ